MKYLNMLPEKRYSWLAIPLMFLLFSAPGAVDYIFYYPDEKYYTDAVLQMMDRNDYFTPYKADGSPRFYKPIITYWVLMGSYKLLGVSTFSSRLMFWLAGALLTVVVYFMTKSLLKDKKTALLSSLITAANPLVLMGAGRSIPDILLVLFLTVSAWGFLKIMLEENPKARFYWMAYMGAALAFETKGLPAAAFAGLSLLFLLFNPWRRKKLSQVLHWGAIVASLVAALSWFIIMYMTHGTEYLNSFFADQVGYRVSSKTAQVFNNTFLGIVNLLAFSLPWIVITFSRPGKLKNYAATAPGSMKALFGFIALWVLAVIAMSGAVFKFYDRYLLPVIPLVSIFFAVVIIHVPTRFSRPALKIVLVLNLLLLVINVLYSVFIAPEVILVAGTLTGIMAFAVLPFKFKNSAAGVSVAVAVLLLWFNLHVLLYSLLIPHPAQQLTESVLAEQTSPDEPVYVYGNIRIASGIRLYSHNQLKVVSMDTMYMLPPAGKHLLVYDKREEHLLDLTNYSIFKGSEEWKRLPAENFPRFLQPAAEKLKNSGTVYYIAKPVEK